MDEGTVGIIKPQKQKELGMLVLKNCL